MQDMCMSRRIFLKSAVLTTAAVPSLFSKASIATGSPSPNRPNIILIYGDDVGYGDLSCYGATAVQTPNVERLAREGIKFTNAYATSATCTPSRYSLLTGQYAWRKPGTNILPGDAQLIIDTDKKALPSMLRSAGYTTGVVGKWHLGLGKGNLDWNDIIKPGPREIGFDHSFVIPATGDRVPCVYVENHRVVNLDPNDPIIVSYDKPIPGVPDGKTFRNQLKMDWSHGHHDSVINGIPRIGYMSGGKSALWKDEEIADTLVEKAVAFIEMNQSNPFFLYFSTNDIHVPRVPHLRFVGKTDMGPRGDAIVEFDWQVGKILETLDRLGLAENTLVILTSDNGPVLDDGYKDDAVEKVGSHKPAGPLRGGKYSIFDAGTRIPFLIRWPGRVKPAVSEAFISQVDIFASLAALTGQTLTPEDAPDSLNMLDTLLGENKIGREYIIEHSHFGTLSIRMGDWKYIEPSDKPKVAWETGIETGNSPHSQLYNLRIDPGEQQDVSDRYPDKVEMFATMLDRIKEMGRTRP
ncbi:MAG TPA: arylsulfatase [Anaerohalosphaeraceae bacterium]|jgi:arylsulfatase A-like enzyme|nr:arylsulfatase [Anaerohalosphaeraceae bacterium]HQI08539.1 arylsulfatase [Anaerohalosphaeraceae bacterium]HQJ68876.1 arylsulfatase [Anaerohalosphaeraceae bacterium]